MLSIIDGQLEAIFVVCPFEGTIEDDNDLSVCH